MKKFAFVLLAFAFLGSVACGGGSDCPEGQVKVESACKKSCTKDEDCGENMECHTDEGPAHCDAKEAS